MSTKTDTTRPKVSLGLPVFNGQNFLAETLDSILSQTFADFELIISDNASTDATQNICESYARKDSRIHYIRQRCNIGAAANYDFVFEQAGGAYFKWCAHDDLLGRDFIATAVSHLDEHDDAVGALPRDIQIIDETGKTLATVSIDLGEDSDSGAKRFASFVPRSRLINCAPFFALFRRQDLMRTNLHGDYLSSDRVLIAEVLFHGKIAFVEGSSFAFRRHGQQYSQLMHQGQDFCVEWLTPKASGKRVFKHIRFVRELTRAISRADLSPLDTMVAYRGVAKLVSAERRELFKELLFPLYRNGKPTALGSRLRHLLSRTRLFLGRAWPASKG